MFSIGRKKFICVILKHSWFLLKKKIIKEICKIYTIFNVKFKLLYNKLCFAYKNNQIWLKKWGLFLLIRIQQIVKY